MNTDYAIIITVQTNPAPVNRNTCTVITIMSGVFNHTFCNTHYPMQLQFKETNKQVNNCLPIEKNIRKS